MSSRRHGGHGIRSYESFLRVIRKEPLFKARASLHRTPYGYSNWREILSNMVAVSAMLDFATEKRDATNVLVSLCSKQALVEDSPLRHLDTSLAESFLRTRLTGMEKPPMPFDHFMLNVPSGLLTNDEGDPVLAIFVSTFERIVVCAKKAGIRIAYPPGEGLHILGLTRTGKSVLDSKQWKNLGIALSVDDEGVSKCAMRMERVVVNAMRV